MKLTSAISLLLIVTPLLFLSACDGDYRARATGPEGVITVVIDSTLQQGIVGDAIREEIAKEILTLPVPEPSFSIEFFDLTTSDLMERVIKKRKNVMFVAPLEGNTNVTRFVRARIDSALQEQIRDGRPGVFQRPNLWYRDQMVIYVTAPTEEDLAGTIYDSGQNIRYVFNTVTRNRVTQDMFEKGRQHELEEQLIDNHGFAVNAQHDYVIVQDTASFVRMRRVLPDTWRDFFVYYIDNANPAMLTPEWILNTRDTLTEQYVRGTYDGSFVRIDRRRPLESENINFLGRYGYETRGLWHMINDAMGGSFVNYTFYDEEQQRIYMLDGMIFAPRYAKREFLRQVEVISHTFRTREEALAEGEQIASLEPSSR